MCTLTVYDETSLLLGALFVFGGACADQVDELAPCSMSNDCYRATFAKKGFAFSESKISGWICEEGGTLRLIPEH